MSTTATTPVLYRPQEAARILRVSRATMYRLIRSGEVPTLRVGGSLRIDSDELTNWLYGRNDRGTDDTEV